MLGSADGKSNILCVTRITIIENWTFKIPPKYLDCEHHVDLIKTAAFARVKKNIITKKPIQKNENLKNVYYDEDGNLQFENESLEEVIEKPQIDTTTVTESSLARFLEQIVNNSQEKTEQINITKIAKDLVIEKFTGKTTNAEQWIARFEKECERFHIDRSDKKIELPKLCIENSATDWYSCTLLKLTADAEWTQWRDSFCNTSLAKIRKTMDSDILIDLIAMGPPNGIIEKIDRDKLQRPEDLHNEIGKLEYLATKKNRDTKKTKSSTDNKKNKTPCKICKDKEKGTRFHPEDECWFKDQNQQGRREENINNLALDVSTDDPKNLMCH
ncbi:hypothetical protein HHI36_013122 [Cryptolaemus montrouzieri]|uniref:Uncharacterized protein n=1 Tax=Cryptolaemus montrouzieri TaxID=559131 RepID=A0ABD2NGT3_9CUCU